MFLKHHVVWNIDDKTIKAFHQNKTNAGDNYIALVAVVTGEGHSHIWSY